MKIAGIIPARLASTRFPNKPLAKILGRSMIEHVYRRSLCARLIDELYIATCDPAIAREAERFGATAIMTSPDHVRGTDRVAEAAAKIDAALILNIQGDEPLVDPEALDGALRVMIEKPKTVSINLIARITDRKVLTDTDVVKAAVDSENGISAFFRKPREGGEGAEAENIYKQIGIYLFRKDFLITMAGWPQTPLEISEKVDMYRIIERGFRLEAFLTGDMISVDTPQDLAAAEEVIARDTLYRKIFSSPAR